MDQTKYHRSVIDRFNMRGWRGLLAVVLVAVTAFILGSVLPDGGKGPATDPAAHVHSPDVQDAPELWTCSMHPNIKLQKPGKCPICFMDLIPLETGFGEGLGPRQLRMSDAAIALAKIQTTPAVRSSIEADIGLVGRVTYDETRLAAITAWIPGRLERLFADFTGVMVTRGEPLAEIYAPELLAAQEELIQARVVLKKLDRETGSLLRSTAEATVRSAREKLRLFGLTTAQIERIESRGSVTDRVTIHSPVSGVVIHKDATEGMYVQTGTPIYAIADLTRLWIVFDAYETDLPWIRAGQEIEFTSRSFPGERFTATVQFIDPFIDPATRTVKVRGSAANPRLRLKPDMFVRGTLKARIGGEQVAEGEEPVLIPATAALVTGRRAVVYVAVAGDEGTIFEGREVTLGPRAGDYYVVRSGIEEGEAVVTNGAFKIDSELQIRAKPSMMSSKGELHAAGHTHGAETATDGTATGKRGAGAAGATRIVEKKTAVAALQSLYESYFDLHMALANDNHGAAKNAAGKVAAGFKSIDRAIFSPAGRERWMTIQTPAVEHAGALSGSADIEAARTAFFHLSREMIRLHRSFGHTGGTTFYLAHCPMAMDGDGADWLQSVGIVWNPFYGEKMLRCGTLDTIAESPVEEEE